MRGDFVDSIYKIITDLIKKYDNIIIMTHQNPDLDGLGASIALYQIIKAFKKEVYLFKTLDETTTPVQKMYEVLEQNKIEIESVNKRNYQHIITDDTLLFIIDVHKKTIIEHPTILKRVKNVVVLDHHIKSFGYIKNTISSYINSNLSSMAEFMTGYVKYKNQPLSPVIATILLAGMEIDTNSFNVKTPENSYAAAAYLAKIGADNILKQELLKENKEEFLKRQNFIKKSFMVNQNMAMCILDNNEYSPKDLATIAEELLQFENVEASFTIGNLSDKVIGVSARSLGKINVETYMAKLGGGGHLTDAACQLKNMTLKEAEKQVKKVINEVTE